jgi:hypothetical protein
VKTKIKSGGNRNLVVQAIAHINLNTVVKEVKYNLKFTLCRVF